MDGTVRFLLVLCVFFISINMLLMKKDIDWHNEEIRILQDKVNVLQKLECQVVFE